MSLSDAIAHKNLAFAFEKTQILCDILLKFQQAHAHEKFNPVSLQYAINTDWTAHKLLSLLYIILNKYISSLSQEEYSDAQRLFSILEERLKFFDNFLADIQNFPLDKTELHHVFQSPLRIAIQKENNGEYLAICFEIPQVYGCGTTASEAINMLDREITILYEDLNDGSTYSQEYQAVRELLEMIFKG